MMTKTSVKLALGGLVALCISAQALEFKFNTVLPGDPLPPNAPPWLTVDIVTDPVQQGWLDVTLTANLTGGEKIGSVVLNFDPAQNIATALNYETFKINSGPIDFHAVEMSNDAFKLQGDGNFDLLFDFDPAHHEAFDGTDSITFKFSGAGVTPEMFNNVSAPKGGNDLFGYSAGAHLQGLPPGTVGGDSTSIVGSPGVPDVGSTFTLLSMGLGALLLWGRKSCD